MSFAEIVELRARGADVFTASGPGSPWGFMYGGQVIAQALRAAAATVDPDHAINSLHAYYARSGNDREPLELAVTPVRDGRSFALRAVHARQADVTVATASLSFHVTEESEDRSPLRPPPAPPPDTLAHDGWSELYERRYAAVEDPARTLGWMRMREPLGDDPVLHACALCYLADDIFDDPVSSLLGVRAGADLSIQSLDFAVWIHTGTRADEWLLFDYRCERFAGGRAMVVGQLFDAGGAHVATAAQQLLIRARL